MDIDLLKDRVSNLETHAESWAHYLEQRKLRLPTEQWSHIEHEIKALKETCNAEVSKALLDMIEELLRLRAGRFTPQEFQNLCHTLSDECTPQDFCDGCEEYHQNIFGFSPITRLKTLAARHEKDQKLIGALVWNLDYILEHFKEDGDLHGGGRWRIADIHRCLQAMDKAVRSAATETPTADDARTLQEELQRREDCLEELHLWISKKSTDETITHPDIQHVLLAVWTRMTEILEKHGLMKPNVVPQKQWFQVTSLETRLPPGVYLEYPEGGSMNQVLVHPGREYHPGIGWHYMRLGNVPEPPSP